MLACPGIYLTKGDKDQRVYVSMPWDLPNIRVIGTRGRMLACPGIYLTKG